MAQPRTYLLRSLLLAGALAIVPALAHADDAASFIAPLQHNDKIASTIPANGDLNPYGVAVVPRTVGSLVRGDVLVSNFNNSATLGNQQGKGTTIVQIAPDGSQTLFAQINAATLPGACPGGVGLTTALAVLRSGWVIVGSLPTGDGTAATAQAGCLIVLDSNGNPVETFSDPLIDGPWDMTALDLGRVAVLFVTNVLNGIVAGSPATTDQGTVVRIVLLNRDDRMPVRIDERVIGSGFTEKTDPAALVIGPTGVGLGFDGTLYIADSANNRIAAIRNPLFRRASAGTGQTVAVLGPNNDVNDPLGLAIAPNGNILTTNGNDGNIVETTLRGAQVAARNVDLTGTGGGTLFGLAVAPHGSGVYYVNDGDNSLDLLH